MTHQVCIANVCVQSRSSYQTLLLIIMLLTPIKILCPLLWYTLPSIISTQIVLDLDALLSRLFDLASSVRSNQMPDVMEISVIFQLIPSLAADGVIVIPTSVCSIVCLIYFCAYLNIVLCYLQQALDDVVGVLDALFNWIPSIIQQESAQYV